MTETVYIATTYRHNSTSYHEDTDCPRLTTALNIQEKSLAVLYDDMEPCSHCCDGDEPDAPDRQTRTCPYCGEDVGNLPFHLPCPESQEVDVDE